MHRGHRRSKIQTSQLPSVNPAALLTRLFTHLHYMSEGAQSQQNHLTNHYVNKLAQQYPPL